MTLKHAFYTQGDVATETYLNLVMDYMPDTVHRVAKHYSKNRKPMPLLLVKLYAY